MLDATQLDSLYYLVSIGGLKRLLLPLLFTLFDFSNSGNDPEILKARPTVQLAQNGLVLQHPRVKTPIRSL